MSKELIVALQDSEETARQAELLYEQNLKAKLESSHLGQFVAIEPVSQEYFLGETISEAIGAARKAYPDRISYVLRIGRRPAVYIGGW
jgi:hypothetical protein